MSRRFQREVIDLSGLSRTSSSGQVYRVMHAVGRETLNTEHGMKVIGLDGNGNCICTVSPGEVRRIVGDELFEYRGRFCGAEHNPSMLVGATISVHKRYDRLRDLEGSRARLDGAIGVLRACADVLEPLASVVTLPPEPEQSQNAENGVSGGAS